MSKVGEEKMWDKIARIANSHEYMSGVVRTSERVSATGEIFTPIEGVIEMVRSQPLHVWGPGKTVLDPACWDGQFLIVIKWVKIFFHHMSETDALEDLYGVDIMRENVDLCLTRLGGGTVLMGNTLKPAERLDGQTSHEYDKMCELFT